MKAWGILLLWTAACAAAALPGGASAAEEASETPQFAPEAMKRPAPPEPGRRPFVPGDPGEEIPGWLARWELARLLSYAGKYDESIREYRKLLRERPELTDARVELANVLFWKGEKHQALEILEGIPSKEVTEEERLLMANIYVADKAYDKAEPIYRAYLEKHPEDVAVRLKLADMLSWAKKYDASLEAYEKILEKRPDDTQVRRRYAFVLIWAGRPEEAARELRKTLD
jgi:thioredoxin-like negative regulator of GroEL